MSTFEEYKSRRALRLAEGADLEKLRLGQKSCEIVVCPSDPEIRFALVPLTEGDYRRSLELAEALELEGNNPATNMVRDQVQKEAILFYSARDLRDLTAHYFSEMNEVMEMEKVDVDAAYDLFLEMTANVSPSMMGLSEEDFQPMLVLLPKIEWSELSGQQWYAAQRFFNSIRPLLLTVKSSG